MRLACAVSLIAMSLAAGLQQAQAATESGGGVTAAVADTTPPVTTSNALPSYVNSGTISLTATDGVDGSGVASTYFRIDGGATTTGTTVPVTVAGTHTVDFWSVDVAGNKESTRTATTHVSDTLAPKTTSNAKAAYIWVATIALTATDTIGTTVGSGVAQTYYRIDGGEVATGTAVSLNIISSSIGTHTVDFWSADKAGNIEATKTATFKLSDILLTKVKMTIRRSRSRARIGQTVKISGEATPTFRMVEAEIHLYVKKPGSTSWRFVADRVMSPSGGRAVWSYNYRFRRGMKTGPYRFKAVFDGYGFLRSESLVTSVLLTRN